MKNRAVEELDMLDLAEYSVDADIDPTTNKLSLRPPIRIRVPLPLKKYSPDEIKALEAKMRESGQL